jgi:hypothetical protein
MKKIMSEKKNSFLMDKTLNKNKIADTNWTLKSYSKSDFPNSKKGKRIRIKIADTLFRSVTVQCSIV